MEKDKIEKYKRIEKILDEGGVILTKKQFMEIMKR